MLNAAPALFMKSILVLSLLLTLAARAQQPAVLAPDLVAQRLLRAIDARPDQPYAGTTNPRQMLDLYLPKTRASEKPLPVVVYIHGGAWRGGDRGRVSGNVLAFPASGEYAAASVGYRLSTEAKWPAQIHDCKAAIRWIRGHARELNLDPERIGVWGASAGGHLVSLLGTSAGVPELDGALGGFPSLSTRVTCVVNQCGPSDLTVPLRPNAPTGRDDEAVTGLLGGSIAKKLADAKAASPLTHITADDAPFFAFHGTNDERVNCEQSVKFDAALKNAGVPSLFVPITGSGHGIPFGWELRERVTRFLARHLRGVQAEISTDPIAASAPSAK